MADLAIEETFFDTSVYRQFAHLEAPGRPPNESTILEIRHRLEMRKLANKIFAKVNTLLAERELLLNAGTAAHTRVKQRATFEIHMTNNSDKANGRFLRSTKSIIFILTSSIVISWMQTSFAQDNTRQKIAQADISREVFTNKTEVNAANFVREYRRQGVPRKESAEFNLVEARAIGKQAVITYELSAPAAIPITTELISEMRREVIGNFRHSIFCSNNELKAFFKSGMSMVHHYTLYRSTEKILTVQLGLQDCKNSK